VITYVFRRIVCVHCLVGFDTPRLCEVGTLGEVKANIENEIRLR
jgi:hypothetical protein